MNLLLRTGEHGSLALRAAELRSSSVPCAVTIMCFGCGHATRDYIEALTINVARAGLCGCEACHGIDAWYTVSRVFGPSWEPSPSSEEA